ncbi:MAG: DMT family transporter [Vicingaceae bacterium]
MNRIFLAHLALFGANLIYGLNYTLAKEVMPEYILPFGFIFCRVTGALLMFWVLHALFYREKIERRDVPRLMLCGLFGVAINQLLFFKGLDLTVPINASIIMTTNPILVLILSTLIAKERLSWSKAIGVGVGISGAVVLIGFNNDFEIGRGTLRGDILIFINATSYGLYLVLVKKLMSKYKPITVIKWVFLFGYMIVFPVGLDEFLQIEWHQFPTIIIWETLYVIVGTTFLAYLFNIYALKVISPTVASSYIYLQPVLASIFAIWMGKDTITFLKVISSMLIFTGVYLVSRQGKQIQTSR